MISQGVETFSRVAKPFLSLFLRGGEERRVEVSTFRWAVFRTFPPPPSSSSPTEIIRPSYRLAFILPSSGKVFLYYREGWGEKGWDGTRELLRPSNLNRSSMRRFVTICFLLLLFRLRDLGIVLGLILISYGLRIG